MSTQTEVLRIEESRNKLRAKGVELGITTSTDKLDAVASKYESDLLNRGSVSATVKEGETFTIPKGYHNGSGTVSGVSGGGEYNLQSKLVTPTKLEQNITSDEGYYGLSDVTVSPIPEMYQDVSGVTAVDADVLVTKTFVKSDGTLSAGTMANNGSVMQVLDVSTTEKFIPAGYHNGTGKVSISTETKQATPTESIQEITPSTGKVLDRVTVNPIPSQYKDTTGTDGLSSDILSGKKVVTSSGNVTGSMPNIGAVTATINGLSETEYTIPAGFHNGAGKVSLTSDIENALAAI